MMNTRVVTRPSLSPKTISRSQSPRCGCCSLICSKGIGSPFLPVTCLSYEYSGAKAGAQGEPTAFQGHLKVEAFYRSRPVFRVSPQATHEKQEKRVFARITCSQAGSLALRQGACCPLQPRFRDF